MKSRSINEADIVQAKEATKKKRSKPKICRKVFDLKKKCKEKNLEGGPRPTSKGPAN